MHNLSLPCLKCADAQPHLLQLGPQIRHLSVPLPIALISLTVALLTLTVALLKGVYPP